jgi:hypothetical protein
VPGSAFVLLYLVWKNRRAWRWLGLGLLVVGLVACDVTALAKISQYFYTPAQYGAQSTIIAPADASVVPASM